MDGADCVARFIASLVAPPNTPAPATARTDLASAEKSLGTAAVTWAVGQAHQSVRHGGLIERSARPPHGAVERALERDAVDLLRVFAGQALRVELSTDQRLLVQAAVQRQVPVMGIVEGFRQAQHRWAGALAELIERHEPEDDRPVLRRRLLVVAPAFFDQHIDAVIGEYLHQRERLLAQEVADIRAVVLSILDGDTVTVEQVGRVLGLAPDHHHLALIAWLSAENRPDALRVVDRAARRLAAALMCPRVLSVQGDDATTWIWLSREKPFPADYAQSIATSQLLPVDLRLAVGRPGPGLEGFRRSHHAAHDAQSVAHLSRTRGNITCYTDVSLVALLSVDADRARWFITEELAALSRADPDSAELRLTLLRYLESRNLVTVATQLHVHRNTVVYRLKRIEQILGYPVDQRAQHLHAALTLMAHLDAHPAPR